MRAAFTLATSSATRWARSRAKRLTTQWLRKSKKASPSLVGVSSDKLWSAVESGGDVSGLPFEARRFAGSTL